MNLTFSSSPNDRPIDMDLLEEATRPFTSIGGGSNSIVYRAEAPTALEHTNYSVAVIGDVRTVNFQTVVGTVSSLEVDVFHDTRSSATSTHNLFDITGQISADDVNRWAAAGSVEGFVRAALAGDDAINGGAGDDVLRGYAGSETVWGGAGSDLIYANDVNRAAPDGNNYLRGEDGDDTIRGAGGFDDINGNKGDDLCTGGDGNDWVVGGQGEDQLSGDDGNDIVYGNLGNDTVDGGNGDDWVRGGQGNDVVMGGAGNDLIWGDRGEDAITGGAGADMFHTFAGAGVDRVTDFNGAEGDRVVIDDHTAYTLVQVGGDIVIILANGDIMVLQGVALAGFHAEWVISAP